MRRVLSTVAVFVAAGLAGCKNQSSGTFTNPFTTADRVPPPSTRVLAPGTAQPYYPGDPVPGAVPGTVPAMGTPTYGPGVPLPGGTAPLTTPPGGWGAYPPQSSVTPTSAADGDAVGVPTDDQQLRFAAAEQPLAPPAAVLPQVSPAGFSTPAIPRTPIQSILPLAADQPPQQLAQREVMPADYLAGSTFAPGASLASAQVTNDGFRPQGSQPRAESDSDQSFRPPGIRGESASASNQADTVHFAAGPNHEWIRGQLEYWPASGEWSIRYAAEGTPAGASGGRVMIDNPQVLANLSPGELVIVQGQVHGRQTETGAVMPAYRVAAVQRQRQ
jgi:hypothetical protein